MVVCSKLSKSTASVDAWKGIAALDQGRSGIVPAIIICFSVGENSLPYQHKGEDADMISKALYAVMEVGQNEEQDDGKARRIWYCKIYFRI
jgi:hypothetical protein